MSACACIDVKKVSGLIRENSRPWGFRTRTENSQIFGWCDSFGLFKRILITRINCYEHSTTRESNSKHTKTLSCWIPFNPETDISVEIVFVTMVFVDCFLLWLRCITAVGVRSCKRVSCLIHQCVDRNTRSSFYKGCLLTWCVMQNNFIIA